MVLRDPDHGGGITLLKLHNDVKDKPVVHSFRLNGHILHKRMNLMNLFFTHLRDYFQTFVCIASHNACRCSTGNPLHASGIGHNHRLHILDDIAADSDPDMVRECA